MILCCKSFHLIQSTVEFVPLHTHLVRVCSVRIRAGDRTRGAVRQSGDEPFQDKKGSLSVRVLLEGTCSSHELTLEYFHFDLKERVPKLNQGYPHLNPSDSIKPMWWVFLTSY